MGEWQRVRIGDVARQRKGSITISDDVEYKLCRVQLHRKGVLLREKLPGAAIKTKKQQVCKTGDLVVAEMDAKFGGYGFIGEELDGAIVSSHYYLYELDPAKISKEYFLVLIHSGIIQSQIEAKGSTNYSSIRGWEFLDYEILLPNLELQHQIASRFNTCFSAVNTHDLQASEQLSLVKQLRQAVLQEAVEGKLTAEWRKQHPVVKGDPQYDAKALLAQIKAEKERLVKEGKIRKEKPLPPIADDDKPFELPDGWAWCKIDELVCSIQNDIRTGPFGTSLQKHEHQSSGIPVWGIESIDKKGAFTRKNKIFVTAEKATELKSFEVAAKDIIISRSGTVGELCCLPEDVSYGLISTNLMKISLNRSVVSPDYFCLLFKGTKSIDTQLETLCFGTTRLFLTQSILTQLLFPLPPLAEQQSIVACVDSLMAVIDELEKQVAERKEQAQLLMQTVLRETFDGGVSN